MSESIIEIKNVNKWFGDFQVLKDINLEVQAKQKIEEISKKEGLSGIASGFFEIDKLTSE